MAMMGRTRRVALTVAMLGIMAGATGRTSKAVSFTQGAGAAVTTADRTATFDRITSDGIDLSGYTEDGLGITAPDTSFVGFDAFNTGVMTAFHYGDDGNDSFVTIKGTDAALMTGLEFTLGDGYGFPATGLLWEARTDGVVTGSGFQGDLLKGTIVGFGDLAGFDELRVAAGFDLTSASTFGTLQAIALDDVRVQLADNAVVPEPSTFALGAIGLVGLALGVAWRRRRAA